MTLPLASEGQGPQLARSLHVLVYYPSSGSIVAARKGSSACYILYIHRVLYYIYNFRERKEQEELELAELAYDCQV